MLLACAGAPHDKQIVTVSIEPQKYILEQITGDKIQVRCLLSDGANPETYDPAMTHMLNLQKSSAYMRMGNIGFEAALIDKIHGSHPDLRIFNTSLGIIPVTGTHSHDGHEHPDMIDPHTWSSVKNVKVIARNMYEAMLQVDPTNKSYYERNYRRFAEHLDSLDAAVTRKLLPAKGTSFVVWHPSLSYFARDYGLNQIVIGTHENKEMSIPSVADAIDRVKESGAAIFFIQPDLDSRQAAALNEELGIREVKISPLSSRWEEEITKVADALAEHTSSQQ